jgi:hypothetical protein
MGLFGVNMPLLYGEGSRAFIRLQEEIIKISNDHSIFAWDHERGETNSISCLANSPRSFSRGAYVVCFGKTHSQSSSYAITNQGLQIELPLFEDPKTKVVYGLIDCHWENTFSGCIGIPLIGSLELSFFERSALQAPETILRVNMTQAKKRTVFISTRPPVKLPFAAEVYLQVTDKCLDEIDFRDLEIINNPMASYHWDSEYQNFRLRWLSVVAHTRVEAFGLLWIDRNSKDNGLAVLITGTIDNKRADVPGRFKAKGLALTYQRVSSRTWFDDWAKKLERIADYNVPSSMNAKITVPLGQPAQQIEVRATLSRQEIFGNEVYNLIIETKSSQAKNG